MSSNISIPNEWQNLSLLAPFQFRCGYCHVEVASDKGFITGASPRAFIYICPLCNRPTLRFALEQVPAPSMGSSVSGLPENVGTLYDEVRACTTAGAYTSAVLGCRKLIMHVAVDKGADENQRFVEYIDFLTSKGYVPPDGRDWVDHIRNQGNEATHEIVLKTKEDAEDVIGFAEMLLRFVYEFPAKVKKHHSPA